MCIRLRMRLVTRCTAGSRKVPSSFRTTNDPKMRAYIINREIDDLRGTLFRQTMFAEFERIIHAIEESGDALTLDVFKSEYHKLLETYFAENVVLDPEL